MHGAETMSLWLLHNNARDTTLWESALELASGMRDIHYMRQTYVWGGGPCCRDRRTGPAMSIHRRTIKSLMSIAAFFSRPTV